MNQIQRLERAAVRAHRRGVRWNQFWESHADAIKTAVPRDRLQGLFKRLLCLLLSGNTDGLTPVGDDMEPWLADDAQAAHVSVDDVRTAAKWQGLEATASTK
jgi:hypothetical protein